MTERLDALVVKEKDGKKAFFTKIGAAFPNKSGEGNGGNGGSGGW